MYVYNHLMDNLRDLSENQVLERMQMIHQRMNGAYSMGKGDMVNQLAVALEMCKEELQNRRRTVPAEHDGPDPFKSIDIG